MMDGYEIALSTPGDIPGIFALQEPDLREIGRGPSSRHTADWSRQTMLDMPIIVCRRDGNVVEIVLATPPARKIARGNRLHNVAHVPCTAKLLSLLAGFRCRGQARQWSCWRYRVYPETDRTPFSAGNYLRSTNTTWQSDAPTFSA